MSAPWFVRPVARPQAELRLFCFAHAGGAASAYHPWGRTLGDVDVWALQLPGREGRMREPLISDLRALQKTVTDVLMPHLDRPFVFFGHSMGAVLAYETARELHDRDAPLPTHLFVSGRPAPDLPSSDPPLHPLPDDAFIAELNRRFGGLPAAIVEEPELLALFLPVLRSDLKMLEEHRFDPLPRLGVPISAFGGVDDTRVTVTDLEAWGNLTTGPFSTRRFPGGHFFLHEQRDGFLAFLQGELNRRLTRA